MMAYVIRRNLFVFRAGTAHEPLFTSSYIEDNSKEVEQKAIVIITEEQNLMATFMDAGKSAEQLKENFTWKKTKLEKCKGGMSLMDFGTLVTAVLVYMKNHYPTTPDEFNFQAELKAASHWYWHPGSEKSLYDKEENFLLETKYPEPALGPHKDLRVKIAALETCRKWVSDLEEKKKMSPPKKTHRIEEDEEYSSDEDRKNEIDDLEESIFDLKTYFSFTDLELTQTRTQVPEDPLSFKMADRLKRSMET